ncbi:unnamed protein product, partial [Prorocentrum cordatum]
AKPAAELDGQQGLCTELGASCSSSQSPSWPSSSSPQWRRGPPASPFTAAREAERSDRGATWWHKEAKQRETAQQATVQEDALEEARPSSAFDDFLADVVESSLRGLGKLFSSGEDRPQGQT